FFFQAEDGIRDFHVTGVQTCALPISEKSELRNYIFATDTQTTTAGSLPWKNSVHIPKLCQIRDNLQANYMATLFPNDRAIRWERSEERRVGKECRARWTPCP